MEQDFSRGHLEELLRERTEEYKMYPTERVWNGIYHRLHTRRKWHFIGAGTFALMILAGVFVLMQDNTPRTTKPATVLSMVKTAPGSTERYTVSIGKLSLNKTSATGSLQSKLAAHFDPTLSAIGRDADVAAAAENRGLEASAPGMTDALNVDVPGTNALAITGATGVDVPGTTVSTGATAPTREALPLLPGSVAGDRTDAAASLEGNSARTLPLGTIKNDPLMAGSLRDNALAMSAAQKSLLPAHIASKLSWLFHFEPTVSFRTLKSKTAIKTNYGVGFIIVDNNGYDINGLVDQRPSVGFELGSDLLYSLTSRLRLKAGLQFNYSRYTAQAYTTNFPQPATISLGGPGTGIPASQMEAPTQYVNAGKQGSLNTTWIPDQRAELSLPVGAEFQIMHDQNVSWNIAGTVQPTYILNAKAFLLSSDYEHYVQDPNLLRRWNMNVAAETFLRINKGKVQLQIGPQIRYQLQPSFINSYPIKEHLYDIGFKIGVTQSIR